MQYTVKVSFSVADQSSALLNLAAQPGAVLELDANDATVQSLVSGGYLVTDGSPAPAADAKPKAPKAPKPKADDVPAADAP